MNYPLPKDTSERLPKKHWFSKQWWKLGGVMAYRDENGKLWTVEEGFIHDYASIPRLLWPVLTPTGPYGIGAVFHDKHGDDKLFLEMMLKGGTPKWLATLMYAAVSHPTPDQDDITSGGPNNSILGESK